MYKALLILRSKVFSQPYLDMAGKYSPWILLNLKSERQSYESYNVLSICCDSWSLCHACWYLLRIRLSTSRYKGIHSLENVVSPQPPKNICYHLFNPKAWRGFVSGPSWFVKGKTTSEITKYNFHRVPQATVWILSKVRGFILIRLNP